MTNLIRWARRSATRSSPWPTITIEQLPFWFGQFGYQGLGYGPGIIQTIQQQKETIPADFEGYIASAYKSNGPIFAIMLTRMLLFAEARFQFRRLNNGRPGKLFGTSDLEILEHPWPNATTGDLLSKAINDVDLAGNFYATRAPVSNVARAGGGPPVKIARMRPDWVTILKGSVDQPNLSSFDPTAELIGFIYHPGGPGSGLEPRTYLPEEVVHWAPIPDPMATYRGMSWVQPVISEVLGDRMMTTHKLMYFEQGATPNLVVSMDTGKMNRETFNEWIDAFEAQHEGALNAYKTLYLGHGATATVIGANLRDLDYAVVQGHLETRLAAAGGVPAIIVGFSEGLEASTYSNFAQARRAFADKTLRPLWRNFAGSLETIVPPPPGSMLWYDDRDIAFLKADAKDNADIQLTKATAMKLLTDAGFEPDSVVQAVEGDDLTLLSHSGLYSVQLQPPGSGQDSSDSGDGAPTGNGNGSGLGSNGTEGQASGGLAAATRRAILLHNVGNVENLAKALLAARAGDNQ